MEATHDGVRAVPLVFIVVVILAWNGVAVADPTRTLYTLPNDVHWIPDKTKGVPPGSYYAILRGKESDKCGQLFLDKFPDGFVYSWHVNGNDSIYAVLKGTLVVGFDKHHRKSAERALPAGSIVQGLRTEPHYGRAVGETIFDEYILCTSASAR